MSEDGPISAYRAMVEAKELRPDPAQHLAAEKLQSLSNAVRGYRPSAGGGGASWLSRFGLKSKGQAPSFSWTPPDAVSQQPCQGLYIYGEVGRGKSMLMDLFHVHTASAGKRRAHFHEFMRDAHAEIHRWRQSGAKGEADPLPKLARALAANAWVLCLDELQVTDIADAMIVGRLFRSLLDEGVVLVITSNRAPKDLYKDGLQRERFLPFIALLEQRLDILELSSDRDYRLGRKRGMQVYHTPLGAPAQAQLDHAFHRLTEGAAIASAEITVHGRVLTIPQAGAGVARFAFDELCGRPLGASDYLELASQYHTLVLSGVPLLSPDNKDEARRFVTLVDALYEHKVTLICSAAAPPERLYPTGTGAFEFQRTVSRLMEMQAEDYVTREHIGAVLDLACAETI